MTTFIGIIHVIVALVLISLVLIQDSKSNGALGMGGNSSNSLLGATGGQSLASKMTVIAAILFAVTCLTLSVLTSSTNKSVVDSLPLPLPAAAPTAPAAQAADGQPAAAPATPNAAPANPAQPAQ